MEIRTERLRLRPLRRDDAPAIARGCADPEVARFIPHIRPGYTLVDAVDFLDRVLAAPADDPERAFAVGDPVTDELLGIATVRLSEGGTIGYWLTPEARGRGLATEATRALIELAYAQGIRRLALTAHPENGASQRVAAKAGFERVGLVPHTIPFQDGTTVAEGFEIDTHAATPRLAARVRHDFGDDAERLLERLATLELPLAEKQSRERILAAIVLCGRRELGSFDSAMRLASRDWRDVLVAAGLGNLDWPARLDAELGPT